MSAPVRMESIDQLALHIRERLKTGARKLIAIAGPPGSGKSTASMSLQKCLPHAAVLQADGFHYDNALLDQLGKRQRKGAPDTFDCAGLNTTLDRLRREEDQVVVPIFDRVLDVSRGSAQIIGVNARTVIVEGNYLASSEPPWVNLRPCFDLIVYLEVPLAELVARLQRRWEDLGWPRNKAESWIESNDVPNIAFTDRTKSHVDISVSTQA